MEFYVLIIGLLFVLAIVDLVVGVSNDAVNFLNSAIGSRVAGPRVILVVASAGIFIGATSSAGMMEVARSGIFNPGEFMFAEVMVIFLAVMLTDIILLDAFNTVGLPTSTTVSIVFELLGAAVAIALIKMFNDPQAVQSLSHYINQEKVGEIIMGILLSIVIAFSAGALIQYVARALFTFEYERHIKGIGVLWSGIALTSISYFLLIKGLKSTGLVPPILLEWSEEHLVLFLLAAFSLMTLLSFLLQRSGMPIFRIVVLAGTFALAMAFAGNDLVNFIGVPLAGFEAYKTWSASGLGASELSMQSLAGEYPAQTALLFAAGMVMVLTLWTSRKARSVTETEVNLGRQDEGSERFESNMISRGIVRTITRSAELSSNAIPPTWRSYMESRFQRSVPLARLELTDEPSFDLVRASVNLTVASILIAIATSFKLPLSTTYVTFMVAMGSSLSDRAWGRDSAVYRVSGVLSVIGGWFVTALVAFVVAALVAALIFQFGSVAITAIGLLAVMSLVLSFRFHARKEKRKASIEEAHKASVTMSSRELVSQVQQNTADTLEEIARVYHMATDGLCREDQVRLKKASHAIRALNRTRHDFRQTTYHAIRKVREEGSEGSRALLLNADLEKDILQSSILLVELTRKHVDDVLLPLLPEQQQALRELGEELKAFLEDCASAIRSANFSQRKAFKGKKQQLLLRVEGLITEQSAGIKKQQYGSRNSILFFNFLLESKDIIAVAFRFVKLHNRLQKTLDSGQSDSLISASDDGEEGD